MARPSKAQSGTVERVMHEFKEGELRMRGSGPKVTNPRQAIAIALHEAGESNREDAASNRASLARSKTKEARGDTAEAAREGKVAQDRSVAKGGQRAEGRPQAETRNASSRQALYDEARRREIPRRSRMSKAQLEKALQR